MRHAVEPWPPIDFHTIPGSISPPTKHVPAVGMPLGPGTLDPPGYKTPARRWSIAICSWIPAHSATRQQSRCTAMGGNRLCACRFGPNQYALGSRIPAPRLKLQTRGLASLSDFSQTLLKTSNRAPNGTAAVLTPTVTPIGPLSNHEIFPFAWLARQSRGFPELAAPTSDDNGRRACRPCGC